MRLRLALIVVAGATALPAALLGPSWLDHRQNPHAVLSVRSVDLGLVPVGARLGASPSAERLLTLRNDGHTTISEQGENVLLRDFRVVCPPSLRSERYTSCGFSVETASDPACQTLKPGASCALAIRFEPRTRRLYRARYCVEYVARAQNWRHAESCLTVSGRGT